MTGVSMEISGIAAVRKSAGLSSLEIVAKAAVEDGSSLEIVGKAAVQSDTGSLDICGNIQDSEGRSLAHIIHFTWTNVCLGCIGISFWIAVLFIRFVYIWQQCLMASGQSSWSVFRASLVLGTEVCLLVMTVLLVLLVPRMIVTWTTALVFEYILGMVVAGKIGKRQIVKDGTKNAKEISWITITAVFEEGNVVAAAVLVFCFTTTAIFRQVLAVT